MLRKLPDKISRFLIYLTAFGVSALMAIMLIHIIKESIPAFSELGIKMFLPSTEWRPVSANPQFGLLPAITGTLYVSFIAVVLALIFGVACACFLNFYLPEKIAAVFLAFIDLVAGIPSVIFGFIGLTVLVKSFATQFHMAAGQCILAAGIVLAIMLLPFVISTCHESIRVARTQYEMTALALGFSREITLVKIIFPAIRPGIVAGAMMAFGRALGETMAVMMVIGNSPIFPKLLGRGQTLPSLTALEMGSIEYGSLHLSALYVANVVLLVILLAVLGIGYLLKRRFANMNSKISKYLTRIVLILLGLSVIGVTLFLFLYVFWKGKNVMSLSFILDKPAGVPIGTAGGIFPALMGSLYLGALAALIGGILGIGASAYLVFYHRNKYVSGIVNFCNHRTVWYPVYFIWSGGLHTPDLWFWHQPESFCVHHFASLP